MDEVALEAVDAVEILSLDAGLTVGAVVPFGFRGLIATYMNIVRGEHLDNLVEYILKEFEGSLLAGAEVGAAVLLAGARKFGIGGEHLLAVAGHLDFGDDGDMVLCGIINKLTELLLGIEAAGGIGVGRLAVPGSVGGPVTPFGLRAPCGKLREARIAVNLHAPSGAVSEVEMELVELHQSHGVNLFLEEID